MQIDPMENWRQLTRHYAEMSDGELQALAEDFRDLTDAARQVLSDEMRRRKLGDPESLASNPSVAAHAQSNSSAIRSAGEDEGGGDASPDEFVWKNVLCDCHDREEAREIREVLWLAGIETWLDALPMYPRVLVAADRIEEARAVLSQPVPQHIIEETKAAYSGYVSPVCPACGAPDPILESADAANSWRCEVCGGQWTEAAEPA